MSASKINFPEKCVFFNFVNHFKKWLTKLYLKRGLIDQQDSYKDRLVLFNEHFYL